MKPNVVLRSVTREEVETRIDSTAAGMNMTRAEVFKAMDAGKLPDTITTIHLKLWRHLLEQ